MFEKEAEEYFETGCLHSYADTEEELKEDVVAAFKEGAKFGYNKAKVEVEESYRESLCNSELNLASVTEQLEDLENENAKLKERLKEHERVGNAQFWENVWSWEKKAEQLEYAKTIIQDLLDNSDEYARQRAMDFLEE